MFGETSGCSSCCFAARRLQILILSVKNFVLPGSPASPHIGKTCIWAIGELGTLIGPEVSIPLRVVTRKELMNKKSCWWPAEPKWWHHPFSARIRYQGNLKCAMFMTSKPLTQHTFSLLSLLSDNRQEEFSFSFLPLVGWKCLWNVCCSYWTVPEQMLCWSSDRTGPADLLGPVSAIGYKKDKKKYSFSTKLWNIFIPVWHFSNTKGTVMCIEHLFFHLCLLL